MTDPPWINDSIKNKIKWEEICTKIIKEKAKKLRLRVIDQGCI